MFSETTAHEAVFFVLGLGAMVSTWCHLLLALQGGGSVASVPNRSGDPPPCSPRTEAVMGIATDTGSDVRPFQVEIPEAELDELRRRIEATRWPSSELVADRSQGVQLATLRALARYWTTEYDWRKCEARLNAL